MKYKGPKKNWVVFPTLQIIKSKFQIEDLNITMRQTIW